MKYRRYFIGILLFAIVLTGCFGGARDFTVTGTVVDELGEPLNEAFVEIADKNTYTNQSGNFKLDRIPAKKEVLRVTLDGYHVVEQEINVNKNLVVDIVLVGIVVEDVYTVSGVVKDEEGNLLKGASVKIEERQAITDSSGEYELIGIAPGTSLLRVSLVGYKSKERSIDIMDDLVLDVVLEPIIVNLTIDIEGEGNVYPDPGIHQYLGSSPVFLQAQPEDDWEFFGWIGADVEELPGRWEENLELIMDRDKRVTAYFAKEFVEFEINENLFMNSAGTAIDLTNNPPYPPGFEVRIKAVPESEEDEFLHWEVILDGSQAGDVSILALDPREFFENYESAETIFTVPDQNVTLIAHFTKRTKPVERGRFDYNATDFETVVTGEVGVTEHVWDLSEVEEGTTLDFYFHARVLPDRFSVYYGTWDHILSVPEPRGAVFESGWVSTQAVNYRGLPMYPEGVNYHYTHPDAAQSWWLPRGAGGVVEHIITKEEGKDVLLVRVEGRDDQTIWDYRLNKQ